MRMVRAQNEITTEGAFETRQTGLGGDAKIIFAILTGMVSDKVEYCLREPGTNAWEANPKRSFELTLPSRFISAVRFRDFGKGLSHPFMMNRYAKIGDSTKDGSDTDVGGWGFGSKSPLSYLMRQDGAGAFDVISRHQGFRRAYTIGVNDGGKLQITFLGEEPLDDTDRGTGIEVSFPVRPEDIERFRTYAERIFWGFEPAPIVLPKQVDFKSISTATPKASGQGWSLWNRNDVPWSGPHIRLGPVLYPVSLSKLNGLTGFLQTSDCLLMEAQIGTISVSTSRESLSYDDLTQETLSKLFQSYELGLVADIQTKADACTSYFDAARVAKTGCEVLGWERAQSLFERINWRGLPMRKLLFSDTTSRAVIRACCLGSGGFGFQSSFKAIEIESYRLNGCRIAVEHRGHRSIERLDHAGLLTPGQKVLWVRVDRNNLFRFEQQFGLTSADYVVLDDIKLPKRVLDPNAKDSVRTKVRVRRQLTLDGSHETKPIDLLAGGLYVYQDGKAGCGAHVFIGDDRNTSRDTFKEVTSGSSRYNRSRGLQIRDFIQSAVAAGLIPDDMPILIRGDDEKMEGDWFSLGEFLKSEIEAKLDPAQLTPRRKWDADSFQTNMAKLAALDLSLVPDDIKDCLLERQTLLDQVQSDAIVLNEHDKLADLLVSFVRGAVVPVAVDPSVGINDRWDSFMLKHPLLDFILTEVSMERIWDSAASNYHGYKPSSQAQKLVEQYITMAGAV